MLREKIDVLTIKDGYYDGKAPASIIINSLNQCFDLDIVRYEKNHFPFVEITIWRVVKNEVN